MAKSKPNPILIKYIAAGYFILIAALSLADTVWNSRSSAWRDVILLGITSLPLLINKRRLYLGYGLLMSILTLTILIAYLAMHDYAESSMSLGYFLLGVLLHVVSLTCALGLVYVGTYSPEKNRFIL